MSEQDPILQPEYSGGGDDHPPRTAVGTDGGGDWNDLLIIAEEEADRRRERFISTGLLLVAILRMESDAALALKSKGLSLGILRIRIGDKQNQDFFYQHGDDSFLNDTAEENRGLFGLDDFDPIFADVRKRIRLTSHAEAAIALAWEEAAELYDIRLRPEHVLLALMRRRGCSAQKMLSELRVELSPLRAEILDAHDQWR